MRMRKTAPNVTKTKSLCGRACPHTEPDSDPCVKENLLTELSTAS